MYPRSRARTSGASLVSLNKLDPLRATPQPGTFPSRFDADALAFIARRHGSVCLADTIVQFNEGAGASR
jgi:hypothetical protein